MYATRNTPKIASKKSPLGVHPNEIFNMIKVNPERYVLTVAHCWRSPVPRIAGDADRSQPAVRNQVCRRDDHPRGHFWDFHIAMGVPKMDGL